MEASEIIKTCEEASVKYVSCPFNKEHRMPQSRLQWHLVKCGSRVSCFFFFSFFSHPHNSKIVSLWMRTESKRARVRELSSQRLALGFEE